MSWFDTARRNGIYDGVLGGNRRWLILGGIAWGFRAVSWAMKREQRVIYREALRPGEQLVISERLLNPKNLKPKKQKGAAS